MTYSVSNGSGAAVFFSAILLVTIVVPVALAQDVDPPTISEVRVDVIGETWFTIGWVTDEPALGGVEWGLDEALGNVTYETGGLSTEHFLNVTGLERGSVYCVRVFATDAGNNTGYSEVWTLGTYPIGAEDRFWSRFWSTYVWYLLVLMALVGIAVTILAAMYQRRDAR